LIGTFTSHVTGNVGRLANDLVVAHEARAAATAFTMIAGFFAGAFMSSMMIESNFFGRPQHGYASALGTEALLLMVFVAATNFTESSHPRLKDVEGAVLCAAMGMQNSLVTRLSGAVVRTTHLTGVLTDIGVEAARWFRWWRGTLSSALPVRLSFGHNPVVRPNLAKLALLGTIAGSFFVGALAGSTASFFAPKLSLLGPIALVSFAALYAVREARSQGSEFPAGPESRR
jgi:uncharacterized membrane protein YoaK (UPF0700 family)